MPDVQPRQSALGTKVDDLSIYVRSCPDCGRRSLTYVEHQKACPRWPAGKTDRVRYVPATEPA